MSFKGLSVVPEAALASVTDFTVIHSETNILSFICGSIQRGQRCPTSHFHVGNVGCSQNRLPHSFYTACMCGAEAAWLAQMHFVFHISHATATNTVHGHMHYLFGCYWLHFPQYEWWSEAPSTGILCVPLFSDFCNAKYKFQGVSGEPWEGSMGPWGGSRVYREDVWS